MKLFRSLAAAFSMYSRIPVPFYKFQDGDMDYAIVFLPLIGVVVGVCTVLVAMALQSVHASVSCGVCLVIVIPLMLTGGFHVDGFLDYQDAIKSYKSKEEKLSILKDPHTGSFANISFGTLLLLWLGSLYLLYEHSVGWRPLMCYGAFFAIVRAVAGVLALNLRHARKNGLLDMETKNAPRWPTYALCAEALAAIAFAGYCEPKATFMACVVLANFTIYFRLKCYNEFGGITGDTIGYFITQGEGWSLLAIGATMAFL